jgi:hypothetical protein
MEEPLTCLPQLDLMFQGEAKSAAHPLESMMLVLPHPTLRHSHILTQLQSSDPIFSMGVDVMRPAYNFETKYRVTMLTKEQWTRGPVTPPTRQGLI